MLVSLNFQFVESNVWFKGPWTGIRLKMSFAMRSALILHWALNSWILRRDNPDAALLSKADANLVYVIRCTLQIAHTNMLKALIRARFIFLPNCLFKIGSNSLLFKWTLEVRNMVFIGYLTYLKL